ncbi:hypothetical protein WJX73_007141 [Symbiochloris irregularis]|uniref:Protein kinase domain-containing protein n=1 Tax=Symbiochloris irregularis TaxID=706552 RepID=A0AAW1NT12_9CHLO
MPSTGRPRTLPLPQMLEHGLLKDGDLLRFLKNKQQLLAVGRARPGGIEVEGVPKLLGFSAFEAHAGSKLHRPCENTFAPCGRSLQELVANWASEGGVEEDDSEAWGLTDRPDSVQEDSLSPGLHESVTAQCTVCGLEVCHASSLMACNKVTWNEPGLAEDAAPVWIGADLPQAKPAIVEMNAVTFESLGFGRLPVQKAQDAAQAAVPSLPAPAAKPGHQQAPASSSIPAAVDEYLQLARAVNSREQLHDTLALHYPAHTRGRPGKQAKQLRELYMLIFPEANFKGRSQALQELATAFDGAPPAPSAVEVKGPALVEPATPDDRGRPLTHSDTTVAPSAHPAVALSSEPEVQAGSETDAQPGAPGPWWPTRQQSGVSAEPTDRGPAIVCCCCKRWCHESCLPEAVLAMVKAGGPHDPIFCSQACQDVSASLAGTCAAGLMPISVASGHRLHWQLVHGAAVSRSEVCRGHAPRYSPEACKKLRAGLTAARHLLAETCSPLLDGRLQQDLIPLLLEGHRATAKGLDLTNYRTALLWDGCSLLAIGVLQSLPLLQRPAASWLVMHLPWSQGVSKAYMQDFAPAWKFGADSHAKALADAQVFHPIFDADIALRKAVGTPAAAELPGTAKLTVAALLLVTLPALIYSHSLSPRATVSKYRACPDSVGAWTSFPDEVAAFQTTLDNSSELYTPAPFPVKYDGRFVIQTDSDVSRYADQYLVQPLEALPSPPSLSGHQFYDSSGVKGLKGGQPDFVLVGFSRLFGPTLVLVATAKSRYTYPVDPQTTAAELYSNLDTRKAVAESVEQVFGYMLNNQLRYSFIFTGEVVTCLKREGRTLLMADVRRDSAAPPPLAAIYYLMHKGAESPGLLVKLYTAAKADATPPQAASIWAVAGRINGQPVAVKVADYAADHRSLADLQHEVAVYQHLHEEQGVSVPRFFAHGWIKQTTCYFLAVELLGPTLEDATETEHDAFQSAAIEALECIHARGVLHRDARPANFLRSNNGGVRVTVLHTTAAAVAAVTLVAAPMMAEAQPLAKLEGAESSAFQERLSQLIESRRTSSARRPKLAELDALEEKKISNASEEQKRELEKLRQQLIQSQQRLENEQNAKQAAETAAQKARQLAAEAEQQAEAAKANESKAAQQAAEAAAQRAQQLQDEAKRQAAAARAQEEAKAKEQQGPSVSLPAPATPPQQGPSSTKVPAPAPATATAPASKPEPKAKEEKESGSPLAALNALGIALAGGLGGYIYLQRKDKQELESNLTGTISEQKSSLTGLKEQVSGVKKTLDKEQQLTEQLRKEVSSVTSESARKLELERLAKEGAERGARALERALAAEQAQVTATRNEASALEEARKAEAAAAYAAAAEARELSKMLTEVEQQLSQERDFTQKIGADATKLKDRLKGAIHEQGILSNQAYRVGQDLAEERQQRKGLEDVAERLEQQLTATQGHSEEQQSVIDQMRQKGRNMREAMTALREQTLVMKATAQEAFSEAATQREAAEKELSQANAELDQERSSASNLQSELSTLTQRLKESTEDVESLRTQLSSASQDSKNLRQQLATMTAKSQQTEQKLNEEAASGKTARMEAAKLQKDLGEVQKNLQHYTERLSKEQNKGKELENQVVALQQNYTEVTNNLESEQSTTMKTKQELAAVSSRAADLDSRNKHLQKTMEQQEATLSKQVANLQDRAQKAEEIFAEETKGREDATQAVVKLEGLINGLRQDMQEATQASDQARKNLAQERQARVDAEALVADLQEQLTEALRKGEAGAAEAAKQKLQELAPGKDAVMAAVDAAGDSKSQVAEPIKLQPEQQQVLLQLPQTSSATSHLDFVGTYEPSRDGLDCLASFDGTCWRLELVTATARNLKNTQGVFPQQTPTAQVDVVSASESDAEAVQQPEHRSASPSERIEAGQGRASEDDDVELAKELDDVLEDAGDPAAPVKGDSPEPRQQRDSSNGASSGSGDEMAPKPEAPRQAQRTGGDREMTAVEREFMGADDSESEVDEEELNRCSDDEVDAFDS